MEPSSDSAILVQKLLKEIPNNNVVNPVLIKFARPLICDLCNQLNVLSRT